ncbi:unnamed protein product, partial [Rotaria magnacalcarata]
MTTKSNNKNQDDDPASSNSIHSPYNLRRNQLQSGGVTKRSNSSRSRKDMSVVIPRTSTNNTNSSMSHTTSNPSQLSSGDDEQLRDSSDTEEMERSEDEEEAVVALQQAATQKAKQASIWSHFDQLDDNIYMCHLCFKSIKVTYHNDCNLRSHLGRVHKMRDVMYSSQREQRAKTSNQIKPEKKRELHEAALDCIITDGRPFGDFRRLGMSKFLNVICPGYRGPSRKTIRRRLGVAYHQYRQQLRTTLAHVNTIAITVDIWTKNKQSFICLTGHAFNKKYESIPLVLGFRHFAGPHKSKSIKKYILYELKQLQIEDKICAIVSDNGGDIKKAVNDIKPDQRISCIAHNINLVVKNGLGLWEKSEKKKKTIQQTTTDAFDDNSESENDTQSDSYAIEVPEEVEDEAMSDTENSTDSEGESDDGGGNTYYDESNAEDEAEDDTANEYATDEDEQLLQPENIHYLLIRLVKRIRSCIVNIRCTRAVSDYVKREAKSIDPPIKAGLVTDLEIRWNTTFIMIDRFNTHRSIVDDINSRPFKIAHTSSAQQIKLGSKAFEFTNNDWFRITDLHTILKPFMMATTIVSAKSYPTLAATYSVQYALRHFLWKTSENDSIWFKSLQTCLREKFHLYFDEKIGQHQKNASL